MVLRVFLVLLPMVLAMRQRSALEEENESEFCVLTEKATSYKYGVRIAYKLTKGCHKVNCHAFGLQNDVIRYLVESSYDTESHDCICSASGRAILAQQMKDPEKCTWQRCWQSYVNVMRLYRMSHQEMDDSLKSQYRDDHGLESVSHWDAQCAPVGSIGTSVLPSTLLIREKFLEETGYELPVNDMQKFCKVEEIMDLVASSGVSGTIAAPVRTAELTTSFEFEAVTMEQLDEEALENETVYEEPDCGEGEFNENCVLVPGTEDRKMAWKDSIASCIGDRFLLTDGTPVGYLLGIWIPRYLVKSDLEIYIAGDDKVHIQLRKKECCFELDLTDAKEVHLTTKTAMSLKKKLPLKIHDSQHLTVDPSRGGQILSFEQEYGIREAYRYNPSNSTVDKILKLGAQFMGGLGRDQQLPRYGTIRKTKLSVKDCAQDRG